LFSKSEVPLSSKQGHRRFTSSSEETSSSSSDENSSVLTGFFIDTVNSSASSSSQSHSLSLEAIVLEEAPVMKSVVLGNHL
jgi:hypothetical protein